MPLTALDLRSGQEIFPGYRLSRQIGRGGFSEVWRARKDDGSACAIKFLACSRDNIPSIEVRALAAMRSIEHRHLLAIDQIWSCSGYLAIGMALADGSLDDLLQVYLSEARRAMSVEHVCFYLTQAAAAIDFLNTRQHLVQGHRVAFRHGDIKPNNLLVFGNEVKLADFGFSTPVTSARWSHQLVGTVSFAAPEIFQGWISDRTDQYALAVSYYLLRTGAFPFPDSPTTFTSGYERPAPNLMLVTPAEGEVLRKALAPVPQDRWATCMDMMQKLNTCTKLAS